MRGARSWTAAMVSIVLAVTVLAGLPATAESETSALEACTRDSAPPLTHGVPVGWDVQTAVNDGSATWRLVREDVVRGSRVQSDVGGVGAKDDRLLSAPFVATGRTEVSFTHGFTLAPNSGGVLDVSTDGGDTWEPVPAAALRGMRYTGTLLDGTPAFTGAQADLVTTLTGSTTADLTAWAGQELVLAWRLVSAGPATPPGYWALARVLLRGIADPGCVEGSRPDRRCTVTFGPSFTNGLPEGWEVDTAVNASGTPGWTAQGDTITQLRFGVKADATGTGVKDDRLISEPFVATSTSWVGFRHRYVLEPDRDGGVLEVSDDGGATWEDVGAALLFQGEYDGTLPDGRPAWTGADRAGPDHVHAGEYHVSAVDLSGFDGQQIRLRWRLLQDDVRTESLPGVEWFVAWPQLVEVIRNPTCAPLGTFEGVCSSLAPPDAIGIPGISDDGRPMELGVRVALDVEEGAEIALLQRSDPAAAVERMAALEAEMRLHVDRMREAYEPLGIALSTTFDLLAPLDPDGSPRERPEVVTRPIVDNALGQTRDYGGELLTLAKQQYRHRPPEGSQVVYVLTDVDLTSLGGRADCVGGIAYPQHSFAMGRVIDRDASGGDWEAATIAAHEIGHLLGGQHHFSNCAEALPARGTSTSPYGLCTLMSTDVSLAHLTFSSVNGAIVRGYALEFVDGS